jgi:hypothetical protein
MRTLALLAFISAVLGLSMVHCSGDSGPISLIGDEAGACVPAACPGIDTECTRRDCVSGSCVVVNAPQGKTTTQQVLGDCSEQVCDGVGGVQRVNQDSDVPDDSNKCTADSCNNGRPTFTNLDGSTKCGADNKLKCNGQGACVGCTAAADCEETTTCKVRTCNGGTCGVANKPDDTVASSLSANDCKKSVCMAGVATTVADPMDEPLPDMNPCTTEACNGVTPAQEPNAAREPCTLTSDPKAKLCNGPGALCVECIATTDCAESTYCRVATCVGNACGTRANNVNSEVPATVVAGDCKATICNGAGDMVVVVRTSDKPADTDCTSGVCSAAGVASSLPRNEGMPCDGAASGKKCVSGVCKS